MTLVANERLQNRYEVVRNIKSGGMGSVYEAIDHKLASTPCAIKEVLASALLGSSAAYVLQSFESEMRALAGLEHPNIPRVRDYFEIEGRRYIVLDLVQGKALDDELADHLRLTNEPMDPAVAAVDMVSVLETLTYLHQCQPPIIHRDIKSANLIRDTRSGRIKMVDFGIARSVETQQVQTQVGTPGFCAPEQMGGRAEMRSDLFSVGATLYHLCTGRLPPAFTFESLEMDLPRHPGLVKIVLKSTQPKPQDRYASAEEMAKALRSWLRNEASSKIDPVSLPTAPITKINPLATAPLPANSQNGLWAAVLAMLLAAGGLLYNDYSSRFADVPAPTHHGKTPSPQVVAHTKPATRAKKVAPRPQPEVAVAPPRSAPKPVVTPRPKPVAVEQTPSLNEHAYYPPAPAPKPRVEKVPDYPTPNDPPPPQNDSPPPPSASSPWSGMPRSYRGLNQVAQQPYTTIYQGRLNDHKIQLFINYSPNTTVDTLKQRFGPLVARNTEVPRNENGGTEYCGFHTDRAGHHGLHLKNNYIYRIEVMPAPPENSPLWGTVLDFIRRYP